MATFLEPGHGQGNEVPSHAIPIAHATESGLAAVRARPYRRIRLKTTPTNLKKSYYGPHRVQGSRQFSMMKNSRRGCFVGVSVVGSGHLGGTRIQIILECDVRYLRMDRKDHREESSMSAAGSV
uniref:Uncharacterized protein n=1 Tax=Oryza rufipogon TaxID=4529 RepID=A0A0E0PRB8_ORYRU